MNKFDQLVKWLDDGMSSKVFIGAYRQHIRNVCKKNDLVEMESILCGIDESNAGLIARQWSLIEQTVGSMELVIRRARVKGE